MTEKFAPSAMEPEVEKPTVLQRLRNTYDRIPKSVKATARIGGFLAGTLLNGPDPEDALSDAQELNRDRTQQSEETRSESLGVSEKSAASKAAEVTTATEARMAKELAGNDDLINLDFKDGFAALTPKTIEAIAHSHVKAARLLSGPDHFPDADQLGGLANSQVTVSFLNSQAYDAHLAESPWLALAKKVRPDRELNA